MRPCPAVAVLVALAACARGGDVPRPATIPEINRGTRPAAEPVRVQGTVTYFDPIRCGLCLQDGAAGLFVHIPPDTRSLRPGQRAEVRGRALAANCLEATEARAVGDDRLPDPVAVGGAEFVAGSVVNRRVALAGVVRAVGLDGERAVLHLAAGPTPVRVLIRDLGPGDPALDRFVDAGVRAVGVGGPARVEGGGTEGTKLLVQS